MITAGVTTTDKKRGQGRIDLFDRIGYGLSRLSKKVPVLYPKGNCAIGTKNGNPYNRCPVHPGPHLFWRRVRRPSSKQPCCTD
jgi:hypothetical protein